MPTVERPSYRRAEEHPWALTVVRYIIDPCDEAVLCRVVGTETGLLWTQDREKGKGIRVQG